jgi:hypothetical protein
MQPLQCRNGYQPGVAQYPRKQCKCGQPAVGNRPVRKGHRKATRRSRPCLSLAISSATVSNEAVLVGISPDTYYNAIGMNLKFQEETVQIIQAQAPNVSTVFPIVEGVQAIVRGSPVFTSNGSDEEDESCADDKKSFPCWSIASGAEKRDDCEPMAMHGVQKRH